MECNLRGATKSSSPRGTIETSGRRHVTVCINQSESLIITQKVVPIYPSGVYRRLLAGLMWAKLERVVVGTVPPPGPRKTVADYGSLVGQGQQITFPPSPSRYWSF